MEYAATLAREEGILIGEERGLKKGRMEGRVEGLLEAAHLMKQNGFSFEQIKLVTCLLTRKYGICNISICYTYEENRICRTK